MAGEKQGFVDRLGAGLTVGLIVAALSAASVGAVALRDLVIIAAVDIANLKGRTDDHESRLRQQEQRPPRLAPGLDDVVRKCEQLNADMVECHERAAVMERDIKHLDGEQERLCQRLQACPGRR